MKWLQYLKIRLKNGVTKNVVLEEEQPPKDRAFIVYCTDEIKVNERVTATFLVWVGRGVWNVAANSYYVETSRSDIGFVVLDSLSDNMRWSSLPETWRWKN